MARVETLIDKSCKTVGEGPHWDDRTGQLLYVDVNDYSVHRWTVATGTSEKHTFGEKHVNKCRQITYNNSNNNFNFFLLR